MHDEVLMGIFDSRANLEEELESFSDRHFLLVAVFVNRQAADELHYEVRPSIASGADVEQLSNVGVIEMRKNLTLAEEAPQDVVGVHAALHDLDDDQL